MRASSNPHAIRPMRQRESAAAATNAWRAEKSNYESYGSASSGRKPFYSQPPVAQLGRLSSVGAIFCAR